MKKRFLKENDWDLEGGDLLLDDLDELGEDPDYEYEEGYEEEFDYHYDDDYGNYEDEEIIPYPGEDYHEFYESRLSESFEDDDLDDWYDVPSEEYKQRQRLGAEARRAERLRNDREIKNISNRELELERRSALDPYEESSSRMNDINLARMEKLRSQEDYLLDDFDDLDEMLWDEELESDIDYWETRNLKESVNNEFKMSDIPNPLRGLYTTEALHQWRKGGMDLSEAPKTDIFEGYIRDINELRYEREYSKAIKICADPEVRRFLESLIEGSKFKLIVPETGSEVNLDQEVPVADMMVGELRSTPLIVDRIISFGYSRNGQIVMPAYVSYRYMSYEKADDINLKRLKQKRRLETFESRVYPNKRDHIRKEYDSFLDDELDDIRDEDTMYQQDLEFLGPEVEYFDSDFDDFDNYGNYDSEEAELDLWDDSEYLDSLENDYLE